MLFSSEYSVGVMYMAVNKSTSTTTVADKKKFPFHLRATQKIKTQMFVKRNVHVQWYHG